MFSKPYLFIIGKAAIGTGSGQGLAYAMALSLYLKNELRSLYTNNPTCPSFECIFHYIPPHT